MDKPKVEPERQAESPQTVEAKAPAKMMTGTVPDAATAAVLRRVSEMVEQLFQARVQVFEAEDTLERALAAILTQTCRPLFPHHADEFERLLVKMGERTSRLLSLARRSCALATELRCVQRQLVGLPSEE